MKIVKIAGNDYKMCSSAYTQFAYKNRTGRSLLSDLASLTKMKFSDNPEELNMDKVEPLLELLLNMAYIMIEEADSSQVKDGYEGFLKELKEPLFEDKGWIIEVIKLACSPISRQLQNN